MEETVLLRLGILIASSLIALAGACTKAEKRENSGGEGPPEEVSDPPIKEPSPCLRFKLVQDEEEAEEEGEEEGEDHEHEEGEEEGEDHDHDEAEGDGVGSSSSNSDCDEPESTPTTPSPTGSVGSGYNVGPGIEGCEEKSQAWIAVKDGGPGTCGGTLVKWCCSAAEIANRFPGVSAKLSPKIDEITGKGLKLYHCSEDAGKTTFHFATSSGSGVQYKTLYVTGTNSKDGDTKGDSCPVVTMKDMGFSDKPEEETTTTDSDIPKSIGELDSTSKTGLLDFLKAGEYKAWTGDSAVRGTVGPHGKVKIFFNNKLKTSMEADKVEQDVGSIAVKEIYKDDGTTLDGYSILAKHKEGSAKDTWFFYEVLGGPDFDDQKAYAVGGPSECTECHKSGKDYIKASLPN